MKTTTTKLATKKITLKRESLRTLTAADLEGAAGGILVPCSYNCTVRTRSGC